MSAVMHNIVIFLR